MISFDIGFYAIVDDLVSSRARESPAYSALRVTVSMLSVRRIRNAREAKIRGRRNTSGLYESQSVHRFVKFLAHIHETAQVITDLHKGRARKSCHRGGGERGELVKWTPLDVITVIVGFVFFATFPEAIYFGTTSVASQMILAWQLAGSIMIWCLVMTIHIFRDLKY